MTPPRRRNARRRRQASRYALAGVLAAAASPHLAAAQSPLSPYLVQVKQTLNPGPPAPVPPAGPVQRPIAPVNGSGDSTATLPPPAQQPAPATATAPTVTPIPKAAASNTAAATAPVATAPPDRAEHPRLNPTGNPLTIVVPLHERGPLGQVQMTIGADDAISVSMDDLANALARIVRPEDIANLRAAAHDGQISLDAAAKAGFPIAYDPGTSELGVQIALDRRQAQTLSLGLPIEHQQVQPDKSAPFSAHLNYRAGETYQITGPDQGRVGTVADLELSGRALGVAFENFATVDQLSDHAFVRTASRLIYDIPGPALRVTLGDLATETTAFQTDPQVAGINFSHLISTFYPSSAVTGRSSQSLTLSQSSNVEILINGAPLTSVRLGPGTYNLRDFPLAQGANNVQAVVTDDAGERRVLDFSFFSDINLLTPGLDEYTLSGGISGAIGDDGPSYQGSQPLMSGFYRRGLTEQLTAGFNFQASRFNQMGGVDGVFGTPLGVFALNLAGNHTEVGQLGGAVRLQYRYTSGANSQYFARTFDVSVEYRSRRFSDIDTSNPDNSEEAIFSANLNQPITRSISLAIGANYSKSRLADDDTAGASAFLTWQAPLQTTIGLGVTYEYAPNVTIGDTTLSSAFTGRGVSVAFTLTHRFGSRSLLSASADRFQQRVDYTRSPVHPTNDFGVNADFEHNALGYSGDGSVSYETTRGNLEAQYDGDTDANGHFTNQAVSLLFDGSIDFAGNKVALGRRITDGFAILSPHESLDDRQVLVNSRFADDVVAQSGLFGPAVVPISSYERAVIPYDVKNLPPGYDLGQGAFEIYPWLHSGFAMTVGSAYNTTAVGDMVDGDGKPLSLRTGVARSLTDKKAPPVDVITSRAGRFAASGLAPGRYRVTMSGEPPLVYEMEVTKSKTMLVRLGQLKPVAAHGEEH